MLTRDTNSLPRLIVIDDLFGRSVDGFGNKERADLCRRLGWKDVSGDQSDGLGIPVSKPWAEIVFSRGQIPVSAQPGDTIENDIPTCISAIQRGWDVPQEKRAGFKRWALAVIDLCFYTGRVTEHSHARAAGMPDEQVADSRPSEYFGLQIIRTVRQRFPELPIVILSSMTRSDVSLEFSNLGVSAFIQRTGMDVPDVLRQAVWQNGLLPDAEGEVLGASLPLLLALRECRRAASHRENLLIRGERGVGKELLARYIHCTSSKVGTTDRPFVPVNSAAFTPSLFASELFGIEPRTATSVDGKPGLIESANGGDLFLDEIGDMPTDVQAAMLRVLQDRQVSRVGGRRAVPVDVRFLSATNAEMEDPGGDFRADLLDRLRTGGTITLPPLRSRLEDIPVLAESFTRAAERIHRGARWRAISDDAMRTLIEYDWPGNVRELRTVIFNAVSKYPDVEHLVPAHLGILHSKPGPTRIGATQTHPLSSQSVSRSGAMSEILRNLRDAEFNPQDVSDWMGQLGELQREQSHMAGRLLLAALEATKRRTPEVPYGVIQIHPAAKLVTGDANLSASKAADLFKRILGPIESEITGDLLLAYKTSLRLRPKASGRSAVAPTK